MADLKYKTYDELLSIEKSTVKYIDRLKSKVSGQQERLKWIRKYIDDKNPGRDARVKDVEKYFSIREALSETFKKRWPHTSVPDSLINEMANRVVEKLEKGEKVAMKEVVVVDSLSKLPKLGKS